MNIFDTVEDYLCIDRVKPVNFLMSFLQRLNLLDLHKYQPQNTQDFCRWKNKQTEAAP